jgi:hypothetical protein
MALGTPTLLRAAGASAATVTTASFTPTAGALLVADFGARIGGADGGAPTISSTPSLTWTQAYLGSRNLGNAATTRTRLACWTATAASAVATTVTCGSTGAARSTVAVREITGASVTTNADDATAGGGRPVITLPTAPATTSIIFAAMAVTGTNAIRPPPDFTEQSETLIGTDWYLQTVSSAVPPPTTWQWPADDNLAAVAGAVEISAATVGGTGGFTESLTPADTVGSVGVAVSAGLTEASGVSDTVGTLLTPSGTSPENPVGVWTSAAASWQMPTGADGKGVNSLTATGVTATTLNGMPAGTFTESSILRKATPTFASLPAFTLETWVQPTSFGRIFRIGSTSSADGKVEVTITSTGAYQLVRRIGAATQSSISAAGVAVIGTAQHVVAAFPANAEHALFINGNVVDLTSTGANINANLVIASGDELAVGAANAVAAVGGELAWLSGFRQAHNSGASDDAGQTAISTWRKRPTTINNTFLSAHTSWAAATNNTQKTFLTEAVALGRTSWTCSVPLLVDGDEGKYQEGLRGDFDAHHTTIAQKIFDALGNREVVIRLGWEANKGGFAWTWEEGTVRSVPNTAEWQGYYKTFWNRIAAIYKARMPNALLDFNVLRDVNRSLDAWMPSACDIVSVDAYDSYNGSDEAGWTYFSEQTEAAFMGSYNVSTGMARGPKGICDFARAKGKLFAVPEWGIANHELSNTSPANGEGFIRAMFALFQANSDILHHECYFQGSDTSLTLHHIYNPPTFNFTFNQNGTNAYLDSYYPARWWHYTDLPSQRAGRRRAGLSYSINATNLDRYNREVGWADGWNGQHLLKDDPNQESVRAITGGPWVDGIDNNVIETGSYLDWSGSTNWTTGFKTMPLYAIGSWTMNTQPWNRSLSETLGTDPDWYQEVLDGDYDQAYRNMGLRLKRIFDAPVGSTLNPMGRGAGRIFFRLNHENNQTNPFAVIPSTKTAYKNATDRIIGLIKGGLGPIHGSDDPNVGLHFMHAPGHSSQQDLGDVLSWCPTKCDTLSVSWHPSGTVDTAAEMDTYINQINSTTKYTPELMKIACADTVGGLWPNGRPLMFPEWSPKNDDGGANNQCPIAHIAYQKFDAWLDANQALIVWDGVFEIAAITPNAFKGGDNWPPGRATPDGDANWRLGVEEYKTRWIGVKKT